MSIMKNIIILCVLLTISGCAVLPIDVNPQLTRANNTVKALIAASAADCTVPVDSPDVGVECANLPVATTTVDQNRQGLEKCFGAAAASRLAGQAQVAKVIICSRAGGKP